MTVATVWDSSWTAHTSLGGGNGNVSVSPPASLAAGESWLILFSLDTDAGLGTIDLPSGFVQVSAAFKYSTEYPLLRAMIKPNCTGSESAVNVPVTTAYGTRSLCARLQNTGTASDLSDILGDVQAATPLAGGSNPQTIDCPDVTVTDGSAVVAWLGYNSQGGSAGTITQPSGLTIVGGQPASGYPQSAAGEQTGLSAGTATYGNWSISVGTFAQYVVAQTFVIKAGSPPPTSAFKASFYYSLLRG